jgi:hypothetical protein
VTQFYATACLPPVPRGQEQAALAAALAPFDMNQPAGGNPDGRWDRWYISPSDDRFAVKPRHDGDPRLMHQPTWPGGAPRERHRLMAKHATRGRASQMPEFPPQLSDT